jgi:hypothetical protein
VDQVKSAVAQPAHPSEPHAARNGQTSLRAAPARTSARPKPQAPVAYSSAGQVMAAATLAEVAVRTVTKVGTRDPQVRSGRHTVNAHLRREQPGRRPGSRTDEMLLPATAALSVSSCCPRELEGAVPVARKLARASDDGNGAPQQRSLLSVLLAAAASAGGTGYELPVALFAALLLVVPRLGRWPPPVPSLLRPQPPAPSLERPG